MNGLQLSVDDIRGLAKLQRSMDSGEQAFVVEGGNRWPFPLDVLSHLGVESGQTVSHTLLIEIMRVNIMNLKRERERA